MWREGRNRDSIRSVFPQYVCMYVSQNTLLPNGRIECKYMENQNKDVGVFRWGHVFPYILYRTVEKRFNAARTGRQKLCRFMQS